MERIKIIIETNSMEGEIGNFLPIEPTKNSNWKKKSYKECSTWKWKGTTKRARLYTGQSKRPIEITMMARREMLPSPTDITKECKYFSH